MSTVFVLLQRIRTDKYMPSRTKHNGMFPDVRHELSPDTRKQGIIPNCHQLYTAITKIQGVTAYR